MILSIQQIKSLVITGTASFFVGILLRAYWQEITFWFRLITGVY